MRYSDYQNEPFKISDYSPGDKFTIKVTYDWMGSPRRDFTVTVYSVEADNHITDAEGGLN